MKYILEMIAPHVTVMCRVRGERSPAMSAFEWLLAAVLTNMRAQNGGCRKTFDAMWASVGPLSAVNSHVFVEAGRLGETFPAFCALMWSVSFMHVQNVNA